MTTTTHPGPLFTVRVPETGWYFWRNHDGWSLSPSLMAAGPTRVSTTDAVRRFDPTTADVGPVIQGTAMRGGEGR